MTMNIHEAGTENIVDIKTKLRWADPFRVVRLFSEALQRSADWAKPKDNEGEDDETTDA